MEKAGTIERMAGQKDAWIAYIPTEKNPFAGVQCHNEKQARLIAAAPDLLAACKDALSDLDVGGEQSRAFATTIKPLRAAIARAEGRDA